MDVTRPLIPLYLPDAGDGRGAPQILASGVATSPIGAPATFVRYPDRSQPGRTWTCLFVELSTDATMRLENLPKTQPVWPFTSIISGNQTVWDGLTNVEGARAGSVGRGVVSWVQDAAGVHVCVASSDYDADPNSLMRTLRQTGLVTGWASREEHEYRWLVANLKVVAPLNSPPPGEHIERLRSGLAALAGYPTVGVLMATGGYDPKPHIGRSGNVEFRRVRQVTPPDPLGDATVTMQLSPAEGQGSVIGLLRTGLAMSLRRHRVMGVRPGHAEQSAVERAAKAPLVTMDMDLNGSYVPNVGFRWNSASRLLGRIDFGIIPEDVVKPGFAGYREVERTVRFDQTFSTVSDATTSFPQVAVFDTLDLYGPFGPDEIVVPNSQALIAVMQVMNELGVKHFGGKPVSQTVTVRDPLAAAS